MQRTSYQPVRSVSFAVLLSTHIPAFPQVRSANTNDPAQGLLSSVEHLVVSPRVHTSI